MMGIGHTVHWRALARVLLCWLGLVGTLPGCGFRTLKRDIMRLEGMALLGGHVTRTPEDGTPIVVGLVDVASSRQVDCFVLDRSGAYFFMVTPGTYRIELDCVANDVTWFSQQGSRASSCSLVITPADPPTPD